MTKKQRLLELLRATMACRRIDPCVQIVALDCFVHMPDEKIPETKSLRYFISDTIDYFLGQNRHCELHYPAAARFIQKWRRIYDPSDDNEVYSLSDNDYPVVLLQTDADLRVTAVSGGGLKIVNVRPSDCIGKTVDEFTRLEEEGEKILGRYRQALAGGVAIDIAKFGGLTWNYVIQPRKVDDVVVGVCAVITLTPEPCRKMWWASVLIPSPN
jgi:hypothetical protein